MTIDHHQNDQDRLEFQVHILYGKRRFFCARGSDLSSQGVYLEVQNLTLPTGTMVDLEFFGLGQNCLIEAIAVQQDSSGIKVMFLDQQLDLPSIPAKQNPLRN